MKRQFPQCLTLTPRLGRHDLWLLLIPALFWVLAVLTRPVVMNTRCGKAPQQCSPEQLPAWDRIAYFIDRPGADGTSFFTQNLSGVMILGLPLTWTVARVAFYGLSPPAALATFAADIVLAGEVTLWNGAATEAIRMIAQRPRPFVYENPKNEGDDPSHYVSFVSGHTSFAAAAGAGTVLILLARGAPLFLILFALGSGQVLTFTTGIFRVLSGRHFVTDVLGAMVSGACVAVLLFYLRPREGTKRQLRN